MINPRFGSRHLLGSVAKLVVLIPGAVAAMACAPSPDEQTTAANQSATAPELGTTKSFAVLAGQQITNTGPTVVTGDIGVAPGSAVTGFPPGIMAAGSDLTGQAVVLQAQSDATIAYDALAGQACDNDLTGQDLGGLTLTPGTYCFSASAQLTGTLTLDAEGDPAAVFVFQVGSTLITASNASVQMAHGASSCNVFWQVGSSATVGTGTTFSGTIIALTSITLTTGASVFGRALARNAAVTMDTNTVSAATCQTSPGGGAGGGGASSGDTTSGAGGASVVAATSGAGGGGNGSGGAATTSGAGGGAATTSGAGGGGAGGAAATTGSGGAGGCL